VQFTPPGTVVVVLVVDVVDVLVADVVVVDVGVELGAVVLVIGAVVVEDVDPGPVVGIHATSTATNPPSAAVAFNRPLFPILGTIAAAFTSKPGRRLTSEALLPTISVTTSDSPWRPDEDEAQPRIIRRV
jgi:hypothetical protein